MVIASRIFALSITIDLFEPKTLNETFSSPSPSTEMLSAERMASFYSSILVAMA
jgi:hypothetical protein